MRKSTTKRTRKQQVDTPTKTTRRQIRERAAKERLTIGLDLGDKNSSYCILSEQGEILLESTLPTTKAGLGQVFEGMARCRIAIEVGTHSPWVSRYLAQLGHEVITSNARHVAYIGKSSRKNDRMDARKLAQLARYGAELLSPIRHRGEEAQADLAVLRGRDQLVRSRNRILCSVRGMAKSQGERLKPCAPERAGVELVADRSAAIQEFAEPMLQAVEQLNQQIGVYDQKIAAMEGRYPETTLLKQVYGVGTLIALAFVLTIEDPARFQYSREVGPYLGLVRKQRDSGESQPELGISKEGDKMLRWLLVQGAHTILRRGGADSDLRRWGMAMLEPGGPEQKQKGLRKGCKKKVVVAVARKLAVLLHRLWATGEVYDPLYNSRVRKAEKVAA